MMSGKPLTFVLFVLCVAMLTIINFSSCDKLSEEVNISDIPGYYFENHYLDNRVNAINSAIAECSGGCETFFWITDMHWEPALNTRKSPLLIKYIASKTGVNKILNGGDTGNSQVICENAIAQLKNAIGSNRVYTVTGNHEIVDASRYELPFNRVADELRGHNDDIVYGDRDKSYFYFDDKSSKTRYIGLSSFGLYIKNECEPCDTDHIYTAPSGANDFIETIDNYKGNGTIACVLIGHSHRDRVHIGSTGIPYIISACDRYSPYNNDINVDRIPGTTSEQHFEVVIIDKSKRSIKLFAIGGKSRDGYDDDLGNEVDVRIVSY